MVVRRQQTALVVFLCIVFIGNVHVASLFVPRITTACPARNNNVLDFTTSKLESNHQAPVSMPTSALLSNSDDNNEKTTITISESDQAALGIAGTITSLITLCSESVLKSTGCGLPAGPFGLVGAVEGLSYLGVVGIASFSLYKKIKTGSGLPAGPGGILGAAEGLSFVAIAAGLVVLVLQITNYGYIPNAVPMEGGMCQ